jgi:hypothetical protein
MQNTGKRCVILLVFIILRWLFNYESNVYRYNKILIDCVFGNSKFVVPSTLTIDLGFVSVNSQCLRDNKLAIPSYPVNKYIIFSRGTLNCMDVLYCPTPTAGGNITHPCNSRYRGKMFLFIDHNHIEYLLYYILIVK